MSWDFQRYSPSVTVHDGKDPQGSFVYPGPLLRELPYFSDRESTNEPKRSRIVEQVVGSSFEDTVTKYAGHHFSTIDRYAQDDPTTSSAFGNAPYWRYTGWMRKPPKFMQVDASDPRLRSMSISIDAGPVTGFTIGTVNSGKLLFQRNDGETYSNTNEPFGGSDNSDIAMWVSYRPVYNITRREALTFEDSSMSLRFRYFYQTNFINTGPSGDYTPPCWHIKIDNEFNSSWFPMIFVPASRYNVFDGATNELRKWYSTNKPVEFDPSFPIDWSITVSEAPPQINTNSSLRAGESHGHQSPYQETDYVFANVSFEGRIPAYIQHTPNTAAAFPKIRVSPITL